MESQPNLFGKTFDQQLELVGDKVLSSEIAPNRRIPAEVVLEPLGPRIRVTARDGCHRVLWGFVACKAMLEQHPCPVAIYDTLRDLVGEELAKLGQPAPEHEDPVAEARRAIGRLEDTLKCLRESLEVKKVSEATAERARTIARIAADADRQVTLDARGLKGMKPRGDQSGLVDPFAVSQ